MSDNIAPIRRKIVIDKTEGGGKQLEQCFFLPTEVEGAYNFYDPLGNLLTAYVVAGEDFNFTVDDVHFRIRDFKINKAAASGHWRVGGRDEVPKTDARGGSPDEPEGSFQASSGPGVPTADDDESVSAEPPPGAIVIKTVEGTSDSDKLKGMYFLPDPGPNNTYNLYNKKGKWIESGIQSGVVFTFQHDSYTTGGGQSQKIVWTVTDFVITSTAASGKWTNTDPSITAEQGGSFQASSGPGADTEAASAASAS